MRSLLPFLLALCVSAAFAADDSKSGGLLNDAAKSDTAKSLSRQGLAKIGADVSKAPSDAKVYFIEPKDGAEVKSPVKVVMGLSGMGIAPAGTQADKTGHHHVLIDKDAPTTSDALPKNENIRHFGGGQTEGTVELKPGKHTLQLILGDWKHAPFTPSVVSDKITITVK